MSYMSVHVYFAHNPAALILTKTKQISVLNTKKTKHQSKKKKKKDETILENDNALWGIIYDI